MSSPQTGPPLALPAIQGKGTTSRATAPSWRLWRHLDAFYLAATVLADVWLVTAGFLIAYWFAWRNFYPHTRVVDLP